jgi:hypothetical protein
MHFVTFIVALVFILVAASLFTYGLTQLHNNNPRARGTISSGCMVGLLGILVAAILFGFFSL